MTAADPAVWDGPVRQVGHDENVLMGFAIMAVGLILIFLGITVVARREALGEWVARMKRDYSWFYGEPGAVVLGGIVVSFIGAGWVAGGTVTLVRELT